MTSFKTIVALCILGYNFKNGNAIKQYISSGPVCETFSTFQATPRCAPVCCDAPQRIYESSITKCVTPQPIQIQQQPPRITVLHVGQKETKQLKAKKCIADVELGDDSVPQPPMPVVPLPVVPIAPPAGSKPGNQQSDVDILKIQVQSMQDTITQLSAKLASFQTITKQNQQTLQENLKSLEKQLNEQLVVINQNTQDISDLKKNMGLMQSSLTNMINKVGSQMDSLKNVDLSQVLPTLEQQIREAGGLNIGDRWRLRFKDDSNKDLFLQDRVKKGYYRFMTSACNHVVTGQTTGDCCCCN